MSLYFWSGYFEETNLRGKLAGEEGRRFNGSTMRNTTKQVIFAFLIIGVFLALPTFAQDRVFNWLPANDESVRLDPGNYHTARTYRPKQAQSLLRCSPGRGGIT